MYIFDAAPLSNLYAQAGHIAGMPSNRLLANPVRPARETDGYQLCLSEFERLSAVSSEDKTPQVADLFFQAGMALAAPLLLAFAVQVTFAAIHPEPGTPPPLYGIYMEVAAAEVNGPHLP